MENMTLTENQVTKKSKLMTWIATILLGGAIALGTFLSTLTPKYKSLGAYSSDDSNYSITLTADELNNGVFTNLYDSYTSFADERLPFVTSAIYDGNTYTSSNFGFGSVDVFDISLNLEDYKFVLSIIVDDSVVQSSFTSSITYIFDADAFESAFNSIQLDLPSSTPVNPQDWLTEIISLLTGGIVGISSGIGTGVSSLVGDIFINNGALSVFGATIVVFAAISLAVGLCRFIVNYLTSLGAKK